jgi:hypothetical protein
MVVRLSALSSLSYVSKWWICWHTIRCLCLQFYTSVVMSICRGAVIGNKTNVEDGILVYITLNGLRSYTCFSNIRFPSYIVCFVSLYVLFVCKCVLYYCHRMATQLQLTNISYNPTPSQTSDFPVTVMMQFWYPCVREYTPYHSFLLSYPHNMCEG